jgi:hypothetical protein
MTSERRPPRPIQREEDSEPTSSRTSPPPPMPEEPPSTRQATLSSVVSPTTRDDGPPAVAARAREGRDLARLCMQLLEKHGARLVSLEALLGQPPSGLPGAPKGTGLTQLVIDLTAAVATLTSSVETDRKAREAELVKATAAREAEAKLAAERREPWSRGAWLAAGAAITALATLAALGSWHWLSTLHH